MKLTSFLLFCITNKCTNYKLQTSKTWYKTLHALHELVNLSLKTVKNDGK